MQIIRENNLPATTKELSDFVLIGKEVVSMQKAKIKAIQKTSLAKGAYDAALLDGQNIAEIVVDAEVKLGEFLGGIPKEKRCTSSGGSTPTLPKGITHKQSFQAQEINRNPIVVESVKHKAREKGELVTSHKILTEINKQKQDKKREVIAISLPSNTYQTIVIDPPWPVKKILRDNRPKQIIFSYPVMSIEEIKDIDIPSIAAPACHIYLWVTQKYLPIGLEILEHWGFTYQCLLTWVKNVGFTPFSWMYSTEHILFGHKGGLPLLQKGLRLDFRAKVREHSRKPDEFYELVEKASPGPRIDFFSREKREDFDQYGNEENKYVNVG